ncbi:MAG TPA: ABC transporter permease, partial [Micromonosporaceae bacterium]|nr:ABC transporter permease [Micromonosporaceae bacterium]
THSTDQGANAVTDYSSDATETTQGLGRRPVSPVALDDVFDDPDHGEPGRDRMAVHLVWELALVLGVAAVGFLVYRDHSELLKGAALKDLLVFAAGLGLVTLGAVLSLRAAVPNLAVGSFAVAAAVFFATNSDRGVTAAMAVAAVAALVAGGVIAIFVVGFHVPSWAVTLAAGFAAAVWIQRHSEPVPVEGSYDPSRHAYYLLAGFAAISVVGGLVGSTKAVRRTIGRFRPIEDAAHRRGAVAAVVATAALTGSAVLASVGGSLLGAGVEKVTPTTGFEITALAMGAALVGGTSAFGRRGGVFGTVLAVLLVTLLLRYGQAEGWRLRELGIGAAAMGLGLVVTRVVEALGRPRADEEADDADPTWMPSSTWSQGPDSWSASLPAQPTAGRSNDFWGEDRWGSRSDD